jgi:tRNA(Ile)-lysidine synthetase-like protein
MMPHPPTVCSPSALEGAFRHCLERLWPAGVPRRLLVALSGGADSTALAWLCHASVPSSLEQFAIAHFNHHLRGPESDEDEGFACALACEMGVEYRTGDWDSSRRRGLERPDRNLQAAARKARYEFLRQAARDLGCTVLATAHHRDDQIETLLLNLERGGGDGAWLGIREVASREGLILIRPLLAFAKRALEDYLDQLGHSFREDSSNHSMKYRRNRLRAEEIPALAEENGDLVSNLLGQHQLARQVEAATLIGLGEIKELGVFTPTSSGGAWILPRQPFETMANPARFYCLREILREVAGVQEGWYPVRRRSLEALFSLLDAGKTGVVNLPKGIRIALAGTTIKIAPRRDHPQASRL